MRQHPIACSVAAAAMVLLWLQLREPAGAPPDAKPAVAPVRPAPAAMHQQLPTLPAPTSPGRTASRFASPLDEFMQTGLHGALFKPHGVIAQDPAALLASREVWRGIARRLDDARAATLAAWLLGQTQGDPSRALVDFLAACSEAGVEVTLDSTGAAQLRALLVGSHRLHELPELAALASRMPWPGELKAALQARIAAQPAHAQQWASQMLQSGDAGQAHALAQLAPDALLWQLAFNPATGAASSARAGALSQLATRDDPAWLGHLLQAAPAEDAATADLATRWAASALVGQRLQQLAALAESGAFAGPRAALLATLLHHANDQEGARALALRLGLSWPG